MGIEQKSREAHDEALGWVEGQLSTALEAVSTNENFRPFVLLLLNAEDERVGGLIAYASWDWLVIDSLAVDDAQRGKGWGQALVEEAERVGLSMGFTRATAETHSAETFYKRLGYEVTSRLMDYPPGRSFVRINRYLTAAVPLPCKDARA